MVNNDGFWYLHYDRRKEDILYHRGVWENISERTKKYMLIGVPPKEKEKVFKEAILNSTQVFYAYKDGKFIAVAWLIELVKNCKCCSVHVAYADKVYPEVSSAFWKWVDGIKAYESYLAIVPKNYRHVRSHALQYGFRELGIVKGIIWNEYKQESYPGAILVRESS